LLLLILLLIIEIIIPKATWIASFKIPVLKWKSLKQHCHASKAGLDLASLPYVGIIINSPEFNCRKRK